MKFNFRDIAPPHNTYLQSGVIVFMLSISLPMIFAVMLFYRFLHDKANLFLILSLGIGVGIVLIQAMVKNYLWSELHIAPLLALAVVLLNKPEGMYDTANK